MTYISTQYSMKYSCLMYHEIGNNSNKFVISKNQFISHLTYINQNKYIISSIEQTDLRLTDKHATFTFDDGNKSDLWAAELLAKNGFTATFFIIKEFSQFSNEQYLDVHEIKEIAKMGHSIGVHGKSHTWWTKIQPQELLRELSETKIWIESLTGVPCLSCSAPGGKLNSEIISIIRNSGLFMHLRNSLPKINNFSDPFLINSVGIRNNDSMKIFHKKLMCDKNYFELILLKKQIKNLIKPLLGK